jgi:hypothetical protein
MARIIRLDELPHETEWLEGADPVRSSKPQD